MPWALSKNTLKVPSVVQLKNVNSISALQAHHFLTALISWKLNPPFQDWLANANAALLRRTASCVCVCVAADFLGCLFYFRLPH